MNPNDLIPYAQNPRIIPETAISAVASSIRQFGFRQPIVVDSDNVIIIGHVRRLAALQLGLETVPVHVAEGLTDEEIAALRLVDNRTSEMTDWDSDLLDSELDRLAGKIDGLDLLFPSDERMEARTLAVRITFGTLTLPWGEREEVWMRRMIAEFGDGVELQKELERRLTT